MVLMLSIAMIVANAQTLFRDCFKPASPFLMKHIANTFHRFVLLKFFTLFQVLSMESGHILIAQGVISDISCHHVSVRDYSFLCIFRYAVIFSYLY